MSVRLTDWMPEAELPAGSSMRMPPLPRVAGRGQAHALTGNDAVALAFKQVDPHLTAAYPITPQSELMHRFSEYVAQREVRTELLTVESAHSALSVVLGAAAAGCRVFTATSALGLAGMMDVYQNVGALRLPMVMCLVNRHAGGLLNIHNDHSDAMLARSAPWIQIHAENAQEAYDNTLQAFRIAEDDRLRIPVTVCHDGFIVSHTMERLLAMTDVEARDFVGEFVPAVDVLDSAHPRAAGPLVLPDFASSLCAQLSEAMRWAPATIEEIGQEYGRLTGRAYGLLEAYRMDDAEVAVLAIGSVCGTVRAVVDLLRSRGVRAGLIKLRVFRPFPAEALAGVALSGGLKALAVIDKSPELGSGGPLFVEASAAMAWHGRHCGGGLPVLVNAILGIGGRDITLAEVNGIYGNLIKLADGGVQPGPVPVRFVDPGEQGGKILNCNGSAAGTTDLSPARGIVLMARGGQGARISSYMLAEIMIESGRYAQAFPAYGPERTGAPVKAFAKISDRPIDDRQQVYAADTAVVFDETLLDVYRADLQNLASDGILVVNTRRSPAQIASRAQLGDRLIYTVDATGIALSELGANRPNAAMLAALFRVLGLDGLDRLKRVFRTKMKRLSDKMLQGNFRAMERAAREMQRGCYPERGVE